MEIQKVDKIVLYKAFFIKKYLIEYNYLAGGQREDIIMYWVLAPQIRSGLIFIPDWLIKLIFMYHYISKPEIL